MASDAAGFGPENLTEDGATADARTFAAGPALLLIAAAALAISAALLIPTGVATHVAGYAFAAGIAFSAVAINRRAIVGSTARVDRAASRSGAVASVLLLLAGFALAIAHAWLIARRYG